MIEKFEGRNDNNRNVRVRNDIKRKVRILLKKDQNEKSEGRNGYYWVSTFLIRYWTFSFPPPVGTRG